MTEATLCQHQGDRIFAGVCHQMKASGIFNHKADQLSHAGGVLKDSGTRHL